MDLATRLPTLLPAMLATAWLLPLVSFALIVFWGRRMGKGGRCAGYLATTAIVTGCVLSHAAVVLWLVVHPLPGPVHEGPLSPDAAAAPISGDWYSLGEFGSLRLTIGYGIDALTLAMFCMVTLVASCIHVYSFGYMHEELDEVTDRQVTLADGRPLRRRGRFYRFYQYLSLFCFSMLGLVIAGNLAMVFAFWELVGICSYLLIGFYIERKSASNAANKAFIVNRVGDFGMLIGLMVVWTGMGTFSFGDVKDADGKVIQQGIFEQVRPAENQHVPRVPDGMVKLAAGSRIAGVYNGAQLAAVTEEGGHRKLFGVHGKTARPPAARATADDLLQTNLAKNIDQWRDQGYGYWLLVIAGLGIFCGCVGKSAQFPLHVWLPDAMEGPTPVSALIHAATMVAAGVYLVARCYPIFAPEVLLVIAYIGCGTLFLAATIAITATDIKRVLAYSTVSQLGYMMMALGLGGWLAGAFHLFTHAFFKALLFLGSGSVIHATGTNEMPQMGGLWKKMPWTAGTMLVGCLAIAGAGVPSIAGLNIGLSGYYSKDFIIAQALAFRVQNAWYGWFFWVAVAGAGLTACYMFRLWYMTFAGRPRDEHVYHHAHESPWVMVVPLVVLSAYAIGVGWNIWFTHYGLAPVLEQARPAGTFSGAASGWTRPPVEYPDRPPVEYPAEHKSHEEYETSASWWAFAAAMSGFALATIFYGKKYLDPDEVRRQFPRIYSLLRNKWWFDELYDLLFVRPVLRISGWVADLDKKGLDWLADGSARLVGAVAKLDEWIDRLFVDGLVNAMARWTYGLGLRLRAIQSGNVRQYVMVIAVGTVGLFVVASMFWSYHVMIGQ